MNKKEFLKNSDESILDLRVCATKDVVGNIEDVVTLVVGHSQNQQKKFLESLSGEDLTKSKINFQQFEILLTKENLLFLLNKLNHDTETPTEGHILIDCEGDVICGFYDKDIAKAEAEESGCNIRTIGLR